MRHPKGKRAWGGGWKRGSNKNRNASSFRGPRDNDGPDPKRVKINHENGEANPTEDAIDGNGSEGEGDGGAEDGAPRKKQATRRARPLAEGEEREERRPKKKVAVLIGYCGTGYRGMQLNPPTKTIEGDLFEAFVKAKAISQANSDDPKKSSLVRCARTDKGVHAAGNVISLKLIIEDPDIIDKINAVLVPQIRIWDIIPTTGGFSCYQLCDSRVYEYLVPTYTFLPPHPRTYFGERLRKAAEDEGDLKEWEARLDDTGKFWENTIPVVTEDMIALGYNRKTVEEELLYTLTHDELEGEGEGEGEGAAEDDHVDIVDPIEEQDAGGTSRTDPELVEDKMEVEESVSTKAEETKGESDGPQLVGEKTEEQVKADENIKVESQDEKTTNSSAAPTRSMRRSIKSLRKAIKAAFLKKKREYRITPERLERVRQGFKLYEGNFNFHNFTIQKTFKDASARRLIKSFKVSEPIVINSTEWLSLKVHGQSFMMHQIRKMVGMVMLTIRSGCPLERITQAYGQTIMPIPKAPSVGLLLQNPVFENYNKKADQFQRRPIDFEIHKEKIDAFKTDFIYDKLFIQEEKSSMFNAFLSFLDNFSGKDFDYLTSRGLKAAEEFQAQRLEQERLEKLERLNSVKAVEPAKKAESSDDEEGTEDENEG